MSDEPKPKSGRSYEVGYGKPPRSGQIKKGEKRNPKGRPRKAKQQLLAVPQYLPTQKAIRMNGQRVHQLKVNGEVTEMSGYDAAMHALFQRAVQGGPMAMRLYLTLQREEDQRQAAEQEAIVKRWEKYLALVKPQFAAARKNNGPEPELYPHPDDVVIDYEDQSVRIIGPSDDKEFAEAFRRRRTALLFRELIIYHEEDNQLDMEDLAASKVGFWMSNFLILFKALPARMREFTREEEGAILLRACGHYRHWEQYLRAESAALDTPFVRRGWNWPTLSLREMGVLD